MTRQTRPARSGAPIPRARACAHAMCARACAHAMCAHALPAPRGPAAVPSQSTAWQPPAHRLGVPRVVLVCDARHARAVPQDIAWVGRPRVLGQRRRERLLGVGLDGPSERRQPERVHQRSRRQRRRGLVGADAAGGDLRLQVPPLDLCFLLDRLLYDRNARLEGRAGRTRGGAAAASAAPMAAARLTLERRERRGARRVAVVPRKGLLVAPGCWALTESRYHGAMAPACWRRWERTRAAGSQRK
jgi:hypothetical protein